MEAMKIALSTNTSSSDGPGSNPTAPKPPATAEFATGWNLLAQALDRVLFVLYLLIIVIFMGSYLGGAVNQ